MAKDTRHRTTFGNRLRFFVRVLGLTGLLAVAVGGLMASTALPHADDWTTDNLRTAFEGWQGGFPQAALLTLIGGILAIALAGVMEAYGALFLGTGRRTLAGTTSTVQIVAAVVLFAAVNLYSFSHYLIRDCTRDRQFTLPPAVKEELRGLRADQPTTIVVLQQHSTFGSLSGKRDNYESAAERRVTEKVRDLVDQFREFGPRFNVAVLDVDEEGYQQRLNEVTKDAPTLKAAVEAAPENCIFFSAAGRVERLTFNEFYQLDKTASKDANGGRGNLVLLPQGVEGFARKVLAIGARRPRVGIAVVHPVLGSTGTRDDQGIGMPGVRAALEANGFTVSDVILKKFDRDIKPAAESPDENKLETTEAKVAALNRLVRNLRSVLDAETRQRDLIAKTPLESLNASFRAQTGRDITEADRKDALAYRTARVAELGKLMDDRQRKRAEAEQEMAGLSTNERAVEARRSTDVKAKLTKLLAEVDVLILPRHTYMNAVEGAALNPKYYPLSSDQAEVMRGFLQAGKPVLVAFGPELGTPERGRPLPPEDVSQNVSLPLDPVEQVLAQAGIEFGNQVVLYDAEEQAFAEQRAGALGTATAVPPLSFDPTVNPTGRTDPPAAKVRPNPIAEAVRVTSRSAGQKFDVEARNPRPVYLSPSRVAALPFAGVIAQTAAGSWNEGKPWSDDEDSTPRFEPADDKDPKKGTRDEERRGPFPVGVAVEAPVAVFATRVPELEAAAAVGWCGSPMSLPGGLAAVAAPPDLFAARDAKSVRVAALGHGGLFTGGTLKPANEKLLLYTLNWLLARPELLPRGDVAAWEFPRVNLTDRDFSLWRWGSFVGLPLLMVYVGLIVLMVRNVR